MSWPVRTYFYNMHGEKVHVNWAKNFNRAVEYAQRYMAINLYGARVASIVEALTGVEHATVTLKPDGEMGVKYWRDPKKYHMQRKKTINLDHWQAELDKRSKA